MTIEVRYKSRPDIPAGYVEQDGLGFKYYPYCGLQSPSRKYFPTAAAAIKGRRDVELVQNEKVSA